MDINLDELTERISGLPDDELFVIVHSDSAHYRPEALIYAKAEINARGISCGPMEATRPPLPFSQLRAFCNRLVKAIWLKAFHVGFLISLLLFMWANHNSYIHSHVIGCDDFLEYWGFPFEMYQTGGFAGITVVLWPRFIGNIVIAACAGVLIGWIFKVVLRQMGAPSHPSFKSQI